MIYKKKNTKIETKPDCTINSFELRRWFEWNEEENANSTRIITFLCNDWEKEISRERIISEAKHANKTQKKSKGITKMKSARPFRINISLNSWNKSGKWNHWDVGKKRRQKNNH